MFKATFVQAQQGELLASTYVDEFPTKHEMFKHLATMVNRPHVSLVNVEDPYGAWVGQFRVGAGHADFPQDTVPGPVYTLRVAHVADDSACLCTVYVPATEECAAWAYNISAGTFLAVVKQALAQVRAVGGELRIV